MQIWAAASSSSVWHGPGRAALAGFVCWLRIAPNRAQCSFFGFAKNERDNIDDEELVTVREVGRGFLMADDAALARALVAEVIQEVAHGKEDED
jgi:hypothetical protein